MESGLCGAADFAVVIGHFPDDLIEYFLQLPLNIGVGAVGLMDRRVDLEGLRHQCNRGDGKLEVSFFYGVGTCLNQAFDEGSVLGFFLCLLDYAREGFVL